IFFFFASRRRHTRSKRDWSSDVCSSDLSYPMYHRHLSVQFRWSLYGRELSPILRVHLRWISDAVAVLFVYQPVVDSNSYNNGVDQVLQHAYRTGPTIHLAIIEI